MPPYQDAESFLSIFRYKPVATGYRLSNQFTEGTPCKKIQLLYTV